MKIIREQIKCLPTQKTPGSMCSIMRRLSLRRWPNYLLLMVAHVRPSSNIAKTQLDERRGSWKVLIDSEARILRQQDYGSNLQLDKDGFQRSSNGVLYSNFLNASKMLREHLTSSVIGWDLFTNKIQFKLKPIWESKDIEPATKDDAPGLGYRPIHEADITHATEWLNERGLTKLPAIP